MELFGHEQAGSRTLLKKAFRYCRDKLSVIDPRDIYTNDPVYSPIHNDILTGERSFMELFGYEPNEFRNLRAKEGKKFKDVDYKDWFLRLKKTPGMMEIYAQHLFGAVMGQTFPVLFVFEWLLNFYPVQYIVELGTGKGGLSAYLQLQANIRGLKFITYDAICKFKDKRNTIVKNPPIHLGKYINQRQLNIFDQATINEIAEILKNHICLVYCDNGNKPKEMKTFAPFLTPSSIIGTHDWNGQFGIEQMVKDLNLDMIMEDLCVEGKTKARFWYKTK